MNNRLLLSLVVLIIGCTSQAMSPRSWFKKVLETSTEYTYPISKNMSTLRVKNCGPIYTESTPDKTNEVSLTVKTKTKNPMSLEPVEPLLSMSNKTLTVELPANKLQTTDSETSLIVTVPARLSLELITTKKGSITCNAAQETLTARTENGDILITNPQNRVSAVVDNNGSITVKNAQEAIHTKIKNGNTTLVDTRKSVHAETVSGNIVVSAQALPSTCSVNLRATSKGNITLEIPHNSNAHIKADTQKGVFVCNIPLCIDPLVTTLDINAWENFKRGTAGKLGSGEATIKMNSKKGNLRITHKK